jgi:hypothetical protein
MLKKGCKPPFVKPMSTMHRVLCAIDAGYGCRATIIEYTGLQCGQVTSAIYNLTFVGAIERYVDESGRSRYRVPGRCFSVSPCLLGVRSIFDCR